MSFPTLEYFRSTYFEVYNQLLAKNEIREAIQFYYDYMQVRRIVYEDKSTPKVKEIIKAYRKAYGYRDIKTPEINAIKFVCNTTYTPKTLEKEKENVIQKRKSNPPR